MRKTVACEKGLPIPRALSVSKTSKAIIGCKVGRICESYSLPAKVAAGIPAAFQTCKFNDLIMLVGVVIAGAVQRRGQIYNDNDSAQ